LVVPHSPWNARGAGWLAEHRLGAEIATSSRDVLLALERMDLRAIPEANPGSQLALPLPSSLCAAILALLDQPMHLDELVERTGAGAAQVQEALTELCLEGLASVGALGVASLTASGRKRPRNADPAPPRECG
jgi:predicted Rossmann fold nucleotide-binding protein DprA/Smf involved in DNA uptake